MARRRIPYAAWHLAVSVLLAAGMVGAVIEWGFWGPLGTAVGIFVLAALVAVLANGTTWSSIRIGGRIAFVLVASGGLIAVSGWAGAMLLLLAVVTSPFARVLWRTGRLNSALRNGTALDEAAGPLDRGPDQWAGGEPTSSAARSAPLVLISDMPTAEKIPNLDDHALCEAWRRSYVRLEACPTVNARHAVVRLRQLYLDELVSRHPAEARRWLEAGARAAGNPLPFLERPVRHPGLSGDERLQSPDQEAG
jgi:hypothetical protein